MANKLQNRIRTAYANVCHLCQSDRNAYDWIERAYREALDGERRHRKGSPSRYKLPASDAACFFAVKWFLELDPAGKSKPNSFAEACSLRSDCLYAKGARDRVILIGKTRQWADLTEDFADVVALDYLKEFVR